MRVQRYKRPLHETRVRQEEQLGLGGIFIAETDPVICLLLRYDSIGRPGHEIGPGRWGMAYGTEAHHVRRVQQHQHAGEEVEFFRQVKRRLQKHDANVRRY